MEPSSIYLILIIVLFVLAASDLIIGISNDAVNFLNAAIGARAASMKTILSIAAIGVLFGATFSSGMMEIARKGIFHPEYFYFSEIMIIFLSVMLTDVILLDLFNTLGMPTSTTVSIVFELLGAAVAIAAIKVYTDPNSLHLGEYINSGKALAIISGILLSVVVAFTSGAIIMGLSRLLFSFQYEKKLKYFGAIWGGLAIAAITYFILIKGSKGASFMTADSKVYIKENATFIILIAFAFWVIVLQFLSMFTKINILKVIVYIGTFALAMAFAGNDLVNFIGVPLAGYESFKQFMLDPLQDPNLLDMSSLTGKVKTPTLFLLIAGAMMVLTLWFSKKAKNVIKTSLDLGRQDEGDERFGSSAISRSVVRSSIKTFGFIEKALPKSLINSINHKFDQTAFKERQKVHIDNPPEFDLIRASVTLVVASILISIGTALKLPLSTTYVTFMVAMGASLADGAWGRESAVYRVTGVLAVIGGWFFTAFSAFTAAFILALIFHQLGFIGIFIVIALAAYLLFRTHISNKKKITSEQAIDEIDLVDNEFSDTIILSKSAQNINNLLSEMKIVLNETTHGIAKEDRDSLNLTYKRFNKIDKETKKLKNGLHITIQKLSDNSIDTGHYYVQIVDYLREISHSMMHIIKPAFQHVENNHKPLITEQITELKDLNVMVGSMFDNVAKSIDTNDYEVIPSLISDQATILKTLKTLRKRQIRRLKIQKVGTRNSMLFFTILSEVKNLSLFTINLIKSHRDFIQDRNAEN